MVFKKVLVQKAITKNKPKRKPSKRSTRRLDAIVPGVGVTTKSAFGSNGSARSRSSPVSLACWDALNPRHLSLPRAVGPYTVIRLTKTFSTSDAVVIIGTFREQYLAETKDGTGNWSTTCAMSCAESELGKYIKPQGPVNQAIWSAYKFDTLEGMERAQVTPSAITVQVMNANPLQTTGGLVYGGVLKTMLKESNRANITPGDLKSGIIATQAPRLMSMPKLGLRGVKVQSYPMNMSQLADFQIISDSQFQDGAERSTNFAWGTHNSGLADPTHDLPINPSGFAPIMFVRDGDPTPGSPDVLTFQVTTEFRVRFDLSNVASASHTHHKVSTDSHWDRLTKVASDAGHGVLDIADSQAVRGAAYSAAEAAAMAGLAAIAM